MISGHGADPVFFNKKIKIGRPEYLLNPLPPPPYVLLKFDVTYVKPLSFIHEFNYAFEKTFSNLWKHAAANCKKIFLSAKFHRKL